MSDVAEHAGVSVSTVSRALRGAAGVAPEIRERVLRSAERLSYVVSRNASGLVTGTTGRIAVLVPFLRPWFFGVALSGISAHLREANLDMLVYEVGDLRGLDDYLNELPLRRNVDAVIALSMDLSEDEIAVLDEVGVPVVFGSQRIAGRPSVFVDDATAAASATRHLINLGHTRIAFVQSTDRTGFHWNSTHRGEGYRQAMTEAGLEAEANRLILEASGPQCGALACGELLSMASPPTAIFAESDDVAMGVLRVLRSSGVPVGERMSVIGFDDNDMAALWDLTTVHQPVAELGGETARLATLAIENSEETAQLTLPTRLVIRRSTAAPRITSALAEGTSEQNTATPGADPTEKEGHEPKLVAQCGHLSDLSAEFR